MSCCRVAAAGLSVYQAAETCWRLKTSLTEVNRQVIRVKQCAGREVCQASQLAFVDRYIGVCEQHTAVTSVLTEVGLQNATSGAAVLQHTAIIMQARVTPLMQLQGRQDHNQQSFTHLTQEAAAGSTLFPHTSRPVT